MKEPGVVRVCSTCPWLLKNQGQDHKAGWYTKKNLLRLWNGLRSGKAPGMVCHSTDPENKEYGGDADIKPGIKAECGGSLVMIIRNVNCLNAGKPQVDTPPLSRNGLRYWVNRCLFGLVEGNPIPAVHTSYDTQTDFGLPK